MLVAAAPQLLRLVPTASLAAILVYTGYKLVNPANVKRLLHYGGVPVLIYTATVVMVVATDLLTGIITGYHVLPYILVAPEHDQPARAVEVRGRIKVSPRLVIAAGGDGPTYGDLFGERELMDRRLVARVFSFRYASRVTLESEDLAIRRHDHGAESHLDRVLDELSRREVIDTGVIVSPDARFYPLSLDRFIREILDQEFRE